MASFAAMIRLVRSSSIGQTGANFWRNATTEFIAKNHINKPKKVRPLFIYAA